MRRIEREKPTSQKQSETYMIVNTGKARPQADGSLIVPVLNSSSAMRNCKVFVQTEDDRTILVCLIAPVDSNAATAYKDWKACKTTIGH